MRTLLAGLLVLGVAAVASAQVTNGTFDDGLNGWTTFGQSEIHSGNPFGMPDSPSGGQNAGAISSWGGNWGGPMGGISQAVNWSGAGILSGEIYAGAHHSDASRGAGVDVLWNGAVVASVWQDSGAGWAADFPWVSFSVPVNGVGSNTLQVNYTLHSAEWSWTGVDNLAVTPEPAALVLLALGLPMLRRRR